ncbi:MAG TPA: DUF3098 domain-containing protein [Saprospiraceae bacterium]|nr:DUF3098 domain-containing protein [Saprospiraceae bacterium]HHH52094.1 DUF3098 domain-containing protein [Bacteroidota bacterium]
MAEKRKTKIITTQNKEETSRKRAVPRRHINIKESQPVDMLFHKENFYFVFAGLILIALGFLLMSGGHMPSADVWDDSLIYSPVKVFWAPLVILIGLGLNIYAIFKR